MQDAWGGLFFGDRTLREGGVDATQPNGSLEDVRSVVVPIYEFVCQSCGNEFEQIRSFSDNSVPVCGVCHSEQVVRRMGRPAIHFKGSGWYITDSKKSSKESAVGSASNGSNNGSNGANGSEKPQSADSQTAAGDSKSEPQTAANGETKGTSTPVAAD